jgi:hypothetical protein
LPVEYFHVVFTLPEAIGSLALQNKSVVYGILFRAAAETLREIAADPKHLGAQIGFLAVLHTWGQNLLHHPHLHCVVPGGGLSPEGSQWISCRRGFFLPVRGSLSSSPPTFETRTHASPTAGPPDSSSPGATAAAWPSGNWSR